MAQKTMWPIHLFCWQIFLQLFIGQEMIINVCACWSLSGNRITQSALFAHHLQKIHSCKKSWKVFVKMRSVQFLWARVNLKLDDCLPVPVQIQYETFHWIWQQVYHNTSLCVCVCVCVHKCDFLGCPPLSQHITWPHTTPAGSAGPTLSDAAWNSELAVGELHAHSSLFSKKSNLANSGALIN